MTENYQKSSFEERDDKYSVLFCNKLDYKWQENYSSIEDFEDAVEDHKRQLKWATLIDNETGECVKTLEGDGRFEDELSLKEWCNQLPENHRVNMDLKFLTSTLLLLHSMILEGKTYSPCSKKTVEMALDILK